MKGFIQISDRQTGKTNLAANEFMKDPANSLLLTRDETMRKDVIRIILDNYELTEDEEFVVNCNVIVMNSDNLRGRPQKRIVIDEFMYFIVKQVRDSWDWIMQCDEVYIFSSKQYRSWSIQLFFKKVLKDLRKMGIKKFTGRVSRNERVQEYKKIDELELKKNRIQYLADKIGYKVIFVSKEDETKIVNGGPITFGQGFPDSFNPRPGVTSRIKYTPAQKASLHKFDDFYQPEIDFDPNGPKQQKLFE